MSATRRYRSAADLPAYWREYVSELSGKKFVDLWLKEKRRSLGGKSVLDVLNSPDGVQEAHDFISAVGSKSGIPYLLGERPPWLDEEEEKRRKEGQSDRTPRGLLPK